MLFTKGADKIVIGVLIILFSSIVNVYSEDFKKKNSGNSGKENHFTVFDIPLNAHFQEVIDILEKKEIGLYRGVGNFDAETISKYKKDLINQYLYWQLPSAQDAEKVFNEKFKIFRIKYRNPDNFDYYLKSSSFWNFTSPAPYFDSVQSKAYPLYEKYYDVYNSQFHLICNNFSKDMDSNSVQQLAILFTSAGGDEPRSSSFYLGFNFNPENANKILSSMIKKYGQPKLYYPPYEELIFSGYDLVNVEDSPKFFIYKYLKRIYPNNELRNPDKPLSNDIVDSMMLDDYFMSSQVLRQSLCTAPRQVVLEWSQGDIKIFLNANVYLPEEIENQWIWNLSKIKEQILEGEQSFYPYVKNVILVPDVINYMYLPNLEKSRDVYNEYMEASKKAREDLKNLGQNKL